MTWEEFRKTVRRNLALEPRPVVLGEVPYLPNDPALFLDAIAREARQATVRARQEAGLR